MDPRLWSLVAGALFGAGLAVSGMMNPAKVLAFLDFAGAWDPSLALVMGGALAVAAAGYRLAQRRAAPFAGPSFSVPQTKGIDARLIAGASLFGVGWGLSGLCPGPALAALVTGNIDIAIFVAAMLGGMALHAMVRS